MGEEKKERVKTNKKESELITKESLCAVCALFCVLALLILCTNEWIFGGIGSAVFNFLTGVFGYMAYPLTVGGLYLSVTALIGKRLVKNRKAGWMIALTLVSIALLVHTATTFEWELEGYLSQCFYAPTASENAVATVTGWFGGLFVFLLSSLTTKVGAIIILSVLILFFAYLTYVCMQKGAVKTAKAPTEKTKPSAPLEIPLSQPVASQPQQPFAPNATDTQTNPYAYGNVSMPQRPAFTLSDENAASASGQPSATNEGRAFSPFATSHAPQTDDGALKSSYENSREFLFGTSPAEQYRKNLIFDPNSNVNRRPSVQLNTTPTSAYTPSYADAYQSSVNADNGRPVKIFSDRTDTPYTQKEPIAPLQPIEQSPVLPQETVSYPVYEERQPTVEPYIPPVEKAVEEDFAARETREETPTPRNEGAAYSRHEYMDLFSPENPNVFGNEQSNRDLADEIFSRRESERFEEEDERGREAIDIFDETEEDPYTLRSDFDEGRDSRVVGEPEDDFSVRRETRFDELENDRFERGLDVEERLPARDEPIVPPVAKPVEKPAPPPPKPRVIRPYVRVPLDDFDCRDVEPTQNHEEVEETKANIIATLEDFKVTGAAIASVTFGPTVTRYNVTIPRNISPKKVVALDQPIAISLHSSGVNIYPNYEDGVVSIEVPNKDRQFVQLGCMLSGDTFVNAKSSSLMFTMGKDAGNRKVYGDISKMIHLLVAGSSGSGKSVFLGSLIISLIYKYSPEELRLILIDPKKTEFVLYNNLPHLMINEIITDANKAVQSLNWAIGEMNRRYGLFEQMSRAGTYVVNLDQYNAHIEKAERLPKIVIIIDELADLMLAAKKDVEDRIQNLTQKARAAGIHLVVATQRPSTDVITGVIKSNLNTRIAFAVATDVDSRVILDQTGAQKLLGKGDFLYTMQGINTPVRVQSAFISSEDSQRVVNFIKANNEAYYDESATAYINNVRGGSEGGSFGSGDEVESVYIEALRYVILSNSASISLIQRKCSIGYNKAGKIVEWMEDMGYISSFEGAKARKVLITKEEFESKYGSL